MAWWSKIIDDITNIGVKAAKEQAKERKKFEAKKPTVKGQTPPKKPGKTAAQLKKERDAKAKEKAEKEAKLSKDRSDAAKKRRKGIGKVDNKTGRVVKNEDRAKTAVKNVRTTVTKKVNKQKEKWDTLTPKEKRIVKWATGAGVIGGPAAVYTGKVNIDNLMDAYNKRSSASTKKTPKVTKEEANRRSRAYIEKKRKEKERKEKERKAKVIAAAKKEVAAAKAKRRAHTLAEVKKIEAEIKARRDAKKSKTEKGFLRDTRGGKVRSGTKGEYVRTKYAKGGAVKKKGCGCAKRGFGKAMK